MNLIIHPKVIFIVGGDLETSNSQKCLLEAKQKSVQVFERYRDFLKSKALNEDDIVLLDICDKSRGNFRLLNLFLSSAKRPKLLITAFKDQIFELGDRITDEKSEILFKPFEAGDLVNAIERLE